MVCGDLRSFFSSDHLTNQLLSFWARVGVRRTPIFFGREAIKANQKGLNALVACSLSDFSDEL